MFLGFMEPDPFVGGTVQFDGSADPVPYQIVTGTEHWILPTMLEFTSCQLETIDSSVADP
jgi:hypothetical protein